MIEIEEQKMHSCISLKYVIVSGEGTWQCCCMIAKQLILVKEVGDSYKYEKRKKSPIISEPLKIHLLYMEMFMCLSGNLKAWSEETDIKVHVMYKEVYSGWNLCLWPTIQNQIILLIAIIVPTQTTYFLFICFFQVQLQKRKHRVQRLFPVSAALVAKWFITEKCSGRNAHSQFVAISFSGTNLSKNLSADRLNSNGKRIFQLLSFLPTKEVTEAHWILD